MAEFTQPEFTEEFKVDKDDHKAFIEKLRKKLQDRQLESHGRPLLPRQSDSPNRWFHVVLRNSSHAITLRIRRENLYLDGYLRDNSVQWLEFGSDTTSPPSPHLIPRSSFLGFGSGYVALENVADQKREDINLGRPQLTTAVNTLATSTNRQERARNLIIVIQMISESIRFISISDHLADTFRNGGKLPNSMLAQENGWEDLCSMLRRRDANPNYRFDLTRKTAQAMQIYNIEQAIAALGMMLGLYFNKNGEKF